MGGTQDRVAEAVPVQEVVGERPAIGTPRDGEGGNSIAAGFGQDAGNVQGGTLGGADRGGDAAGDALSAIREGVFEEVEGTAGSGKGFVDEPAVLEGDGGPPEGGCGLDGGDGKRSTAAGGERDETGGADFAGGAKVQDEIERAWDEGSEKTVKRGPPAGA